MAKYAPDNVMDSGLSWIQSNSNKLCICSTQPTTYAQANVSYKLGSVADASICGAPQDWATSGREVAIAAKSSVTITTGSSAQHIALISTTSSVLAYVTTISAQAVSASDKMNVATWDIRIADVTA